MRILLGLSILALGFMFITTINPSLGPGLSMKNAFEYLPVALVTLNAILGQPLRLENRVIHAWFAVLLSYAMVSVVLGALVFKYPEYGLKDNFWDLKGTLFDWWIIFFVFSQCPQRAEDVEKLIKLLLIVVSLGNALTVGQLIGIVNLHRDIWCEEEVGSRICGVFGHANETGALIAILIPAYVAAAESSSGSRRLFWICTLAPSITVMVLVASRGAFVGFIFGGAWAAMYCRKYLSTQRFIKWTTWTAAMLVPMLLVVGFKYWHIMMGRWSEGSKVSAASMTSGRTEIWLAYLLKMAEDPWTFLTGFGWNSYAVANFPVIPHNQYLSTWFEIGIIGLMGLVIIFRMAVITALAGARWAPPNSNARRFIVAGVFGILILCVDIFFGTMYVLWQFTWLYMGLILRYANLVQRERAPQPQTRLPPQRTSKPLPRSTVSVRSA